MSAFGDNGEMGINLQKVGEYAGFLLSKGDKRMKGKEAILEGCLRKVSVSVRGRDWRGLDQAIKKRIRKGY